MTTPLNDDERAELETLRAQKEDTFLPQKDHKEDYFPPLPFAGQYPDDPSQPSVMTDSDREELAAFRANKENPVKPDDEPLPDTHWLALADGRTIKTKGVMSHYEGIPVIRSTEMPPELNAKPADQHRF
jgi:hypothetical protein